MDPHRTATFTLTTNTAMPDRFVQQQAQLIIYATLAEIIGKAVLLAQSDPAIWHVDCHENHRFAFRVDCDHHRDRYTIQYTVESDT